MPKKVIFFDIETYGIERLWNMSPEEYFRLGGYAFGRTGPVRLTDDIEELREAIRSADIISGHNIHSFDLTALFGADSTEPLEMAKQRRVFDSWTHSTLVHPAPQMYFDRRRNPRYVKGPEQAKSWHSLDNQAFQLGTPGKIHDLKDLAREFGGFGDIPINDPRFRDYLVGDVLCQRQVAMRLLELGPLDDYAWREQENAAIDAQNSRNGWRIDRQVATSRRDELDAIRRHHMTMLVEKHGMPTTGKAPLRSTAGKEAVLAALQSVGISETELPRTRKGQPSLGGQGIKSAAEGKGEAAVELATAIAEISGLRPLAQSALDHCQPDGRVHPQINTLQRSGRKSTQDPGLTVWTSRGNGKVEKRYFVPNGPDELLVEFDYSQADARIVAAYSGDAEFAQRFAPGADAHLITAWAVWGRETVGSDRSNPVTESYRQTAKACGHAYAFRAGPRTIAKTAGVSLDVAQKFVEGMQQQYRDVTKWQDRVTKDAKRAGYVINDWGRRMPVQKDREWTQAPALFGQSGTREIVVDALLRLPITIVRMLVAQIHDALVFSIPRDSLDETINTIRASMECYWQPKHGGQKVFFPVGVGTPALNWEECSH